VFYKKPAFSHTGKRRVLYVIDHATLKTVAAEVLFLLRVCAAIPSRQPLFQLLPGAAIIDFNTEGIAQDKKITNKAVLALSRKDRRTGRQGHPYASFNIDFHCLDSQLSVRPSFFLFCVQQWARIECFHAIIMLQCLAVVKV
jgi:hypothetical protein